MERDRETVHPYGIMEPLQKESSPGSRHEVQSERIGFTEGE